MNKKHAAISTLTVYIVENFILSMLSWLAHFFMHLSILAKKYMNVLNISFNKWT